ncbi:leucine-rich repeat protein kinase family protein [Tanacetum coccineum]
MDSMHSTLSMYYDYDAHVKGELLVMMKNSQSVNLLIFISNTLIELFNDFGFDCDGIPERPTMYLNLWSYKVVRYRYSNPMIQPEPEGSTQGYPLDSVEVLSETSSCWITYIVLSALRCSVIRTASAAAFFGILPDHSDMSIDFQINFSIQSVRPRLAGSLISWSNRIRQSDKVLKLKNFKKDATLKLFKSTNREWYEHVGPEVTSSQDGEMRLCLVDDLKHRLFDGNQLTRRIPSTIRRLKTLEALRLDRNALEGEVLLTLNRLTSLSELYLSYNKLSGALPDLSGMISLTYV